MLQVLASMNPHPESVPVNGLVAVEGTPLEEQAPFEPLELLRMVATARILMPHARVRLSVGRESMSREAQILVYRRGPIQSSTAMFCSRQATRTWRPTANCSPMRGDRQLAGGRNGFGQLLAPLIRRGLQTLSTEGLMDRSTSTEEGIEAPSHHRRADHRPPRQSPTGNTARRLIVGAVSVELHRMGQRLSHENRQLQRSTHGKPHL